MNFTIVGNGVAGYTAALTLSRLAPGAQIAVYAAEAHPYYPRPLLPEFLAGELDLDRLYLKPVPWYVERNIALHLGTPVAAIIPQKHQITLADGTTTSYDRLLLAAGGHAWVPPIRGADKPGVFTLRTVDDAQAIQIRARSVRRAIVIGCGLLGLEAARALRVLGLKVTMVEFLPRLLPRQLDAEGAAVLQGLIEDQGLEITLNAASEEILGTDGVTGLRLKDGREIEGGLVLVSTGIRSNVALARQAELELNRGVVVDEHLRTSAADIYAAGDVAEFAGGVYGIVPAAIEQARVAAAHMTGDESVTYGGTVLSTTLKVTGIDLTSVGTIVPEQGREAEYQELRRADAARGLYRKLVLKDGRIVGAILLGDKSRVRPVTQLINGGVDVSAHAERLLDDDFDLQALL
ncbi:MAG: NAD(P)/FAD-dependent oxidoreductase [Chloroflexi bacterium]|nr:NAD(P)/FAD-dependent oxidoreductase [Chloroflexota bacterium]